MNERLCQTMCDFVFCLFQVASNIYVVYFIINGEYVNCHLSFKAIDFSGCPIDANGRKG